jgi:hypothetical protein
MDTTELMVQELATADYGSESVVKMDDGRVIRCRVEIDDIPASEHINDADGWGKVSEYAYDYHRAGNTPRPDGFDSNAEKIQVDRGAWMWWQPPTDVARTDPHFAEVRQEVRDLLEMGFRGVVLELCNGIDAYGRPIVTEVASLWGIDSLDNGYMATVVAELLDELLDR